MCICPGYGKCLAIALLLVAPLLLSNSTSQTLSSSPEVRVKLTGPIRITKSTRIIPGTYQIRVAPGKAVIEIDGDNVTLNLSGVTITSGITDPWDRVGTGIYSEGHNHVTITGGAVHGYKYGIFIQGVDRGVKIIGTDVSCNRAQRLLSTLTHFNVKDWLDIFHLDSWESYGAGLYLKNVEYGWVKGVSAHNEQNGILLANVTHTTVMDNNVSHNSGWGIGLFNSSWNDILDNHADWDVRCEGKTYSAGCDSAGVLLMDGSDHNRIIGNSFIHSGDGYFVSKPHTGHASNDNYVAYNNGSYSPHNAFESTFTSGDQFYHNTANHSDYGFWLGFSRNTTVTDNQIENCKHDGIAIEHGSGNFIVRNQIVDNGEVGIRLFRRQPVPNPSRSYVILENQIAGNKIGILLNQTYDVMATMNDFSNNPVSISVEKESHRILVRDNNFTSSEGKKIEVDSTSSVITN